ncbi:hypothetical protein R6Q59_017841 [Mikania micrantha]
MGAGGYSRDDRLLIDKLRKDRQSATNDINDLVMMANGGDIQRTSNAPNDQRVENSLHFKGSKDQTSPTFQQLLQRDGSKWSRISSQIKKIEDDGNRHRKKSVLAKVKEAAKRLKLTLRRKKDSDTNESRFVGPKDNGEDDAEYHSARSKCISLRSKVHA